MTSISAVVSLLFQIIVQSILVYCFIVLLLLLLYYFRGSYTSSLYLQKIRHYIIVRYLLALCFIPMVHSLYIDPWILDIDIDANYEY